LIEEDLQASNDNHLVITRKYQFPNKTKGLLVTKHQPKPKTSERTKATSEIEYLQRMVNKLTNEMIGMKIGVAENPPP